jgi:hypothetical protein
MDFLDPKRKKSHRKRLMLGYLLMAVAVAMGTLILLFSAFGYWVDRKTGDVIQNGTVFIDSQPGGSSIYLNNVLQGNKTAARLVVPGSQQYTVKLAQNGYRDWARTFTLQGGNIERLVYPLLIPKTLVTKESQLYATAPGLTKQSPDKRWLLMQQPGQTYVFDLYDLNSTSPIPAVITIPSNIMTDPTAASTLNIVEWSSDNHRLLISRSTSSLSEFLMIDTTSIASSVNINTTLGVTPSGVSLRDKKGDQLYIFDQTGGVIRYGDLKNRTISGPILTGVLDYETNGPDIILYATKTGAADGKVGVRIRENDKASYLLKTIQESTKYLLDVNEFDGTPYYVVGSDVDGAAFVYKDPLPTLKGQQSKVLLIPSVMRLANLKFVSFSPNNKFIASQSGNNLVIYDIEGDRQFKLSLNHIIPESDKTIWTDGFHFQFTDKGQAYIVDFDGSNEQPLVPSLDGQLYFSADNKNVFAVAPSKNVTGRFALTETSLQKK